MKITLNEISIFLTTVYLSLNQYTYQTAKKVNSQGIKRKS